MRTAETSRIGRHPQTAHCVPVIHERSDIRSDQQQYRRHIISIEPTLNFQGRFNFLRISNLIYASSLSIAHRRSLHRHLVHFIKQFLRNRFIGIFSYRIPILRQLNESLGKVISLSGRIHNKRASSFRSSIKQIMLFSCVKHRNAKSVAIAKPIILKWY